LNEKSKILKKCPSSKEFLNFVKEGLAKHDFESFDDYEASLDHIVHYAINDIEMMNEFKKKVLRSLTIEMR
jgi:hypothetical protein